MTLVTFQPADHAVIATPSTLGLTRTGAFVLRMIGRRRRITAVADVTSGHLIAQLRVAGHRVGLQRQHVV